MISNEGKRKIRAILLAACASGMMCAPAVVHAQDSTRASYDIGAQDLGEALTQLAQQSNREIYFPADLTRGKRAPRVRGSMTLEQALGRLLEGTGLRYRFAASGAIVVERSGGPAAASLDETDETTHASDDGIVVTGTRIRSRESGPSPVTEITREDFARQGASSPQDVLRTVPQNFLGGVQEFGSALSSTRNGNEGNLSGGTGVNLRGLGNAATLTLLNGRRLAPGGLGGFVDVSTLPLSAIERIEIVADGASAIYGSDAVAGVVNFVLRDDFRGAETTLRYSTVTDGGLRRYSASQLFGVGSDDESLMVVLDYGRRKPLDASDRDFASGVSDPAGTRSDLTVGDERYSLLANFHKEFGDSLRIEGLGFYNSRDSYSVNYDPFSVRTGTRDNQQTEYGGTLDLEWDVGADWRVTGAQSYAYSEGHRINFAAATPTQPALDNNLTVEQEVFTTTLDAEGALLALPGGTARLALGGEYRKETLFSEASFSPVPRPPLSREVAAGYAELFVPIVGPDNAGAFGRRLEFTGAIRYEDYSDVGDTDNVKFGAVWEPLDGFALRGTYGTSFRAPYLYQFDSTLGSGLIYPLPSASGTIVTAIISGLPASDLGPETATTWTAGFDFAPPGANWLRVNGTYFDIDFENRITENAVTFDLYSNPLLLPLVAMPPDPEIMAILPTLAFFDSPFGYALSDVQATFDGRIRNQARTQMNGVDFTVATTFDLGGGTLDAGVNGSYIIEFVNRQISSAPAIDVVDTIFNPADLRLRGNLGWSDGQLSISTFVNYVDGYRDNQVLTDVQKIGSWTTVDVNVGYRFASTSPILDGLSLRATVNNLFDEDPPAIDFVQASYGNAGFDYENADPIGRLVVLELVKTW